MTMLSENLSQNFRPEVFAERSRRRGKAKSRRTMQSADWSRPARRAEREMSEAFTASLLHGIALGLRTTLGRALREVCGIALRHVGSFRGGMSSPAISCGCQ